MEKGIAQLSSTHKDDSKKDPARKRSHIQLTSTCKDSSKKDPARESHPNPVLRDQLILQETHL